LYYASVAMRNSALFDRRLSPRAQAFTEIAVFSGSAHPLLAAEICAHLDVPLLCRRKIEMSPSAQSRDDTPLAADTPTGSLQRG
jgi:hypothetical protein